MSNFTPGPWHWENGYRGLVAENGDCILDYSDHEGMWIPTYLDQAEANAYLIAAAPELLENLIGCMEALSSHVPDCVEVQCARAVIAKATGQ